MRLMIPALALATACAVAVPASAEVTHSVQGRFGVAYNSQSGQSQALYEGRYTTTFSHRSDNGLTFRFELGVVLGNIESRRPWPGEARTVSVSTGTGTGTGTGN